MQGWKAYKPEIQGAAKEISQHTSICVFSRPSCLNLKSRMRHIETIQPFVCLMLVLPQGILESTLASIIPRILHVYLRRPAILPFFCC